MDLRRVLAVLRARWRFLGVALLVGAGLTVYLTVTSAAVYASSSTLFVSTPPTQSGVTDAFVASVVTQERTKSYARLVSDDSVLQRSADRLGDISAGALGAAVSSTYVEETLLLKIESRAESAERAQEINAVVSDEVLNEIVELEKPKNATSEDAKTLPFVAGLASKASLPSSPVEPRAPLSLGTGLLLALAAGLAATLVREALDTTVQSGEEIEALTGIAPLAVLPVDDQAARDVTSRSSDPFGASNEAFRVLATNLSFGLDRDRFTTLVTSIGPGGGTTYVATRLAIALGRASGSVLLVDADLRKPGARRETDDAAEDTDDLGLVSVLLGDASVDDAIRELVPGVDVLPAGALPPNPAEVLGTEAMRDLLADLRQRYAVVVIDVPPLRVADPAILAPVVDGAVIVAEHGVTHRDELGQALSRIRAVGGTVFGAVLNLAPRNAVERYSYGYGYQPDPTRGARKKARPARRSEGRRVKR